MYLQKNTQSIVEVHAQREKVAGCNSTIYWVLALAVLLDAAVVVRVAPSVRTKKAPNPSPKYRTTEGVKL